MAIFGRYSCEVSVHHRFIYDATRETWVGFPLPPPLYGVLRRDHAVSARPRYQRSTHRPLSPLRRNLLPSRPPTLHPTATTVAVALPADVGRCGLFRRLIPLRLSAHSPCHHRSFYSQPILGCLSATRSSGGMPPVRPGALITPDAPGEPVNVQSLDCHLLLPCREEIFYAS